MSIYPGEIDEFRNTTNIQGVEYNPADTTTVYAEDTNAHSSAIIAIEETLGENPQGDYETVAARLAAAPAGGGAWDFVGQVVATGSQNELFIDTLDLATDEAYLVFFSIQNNSDTSSLTLSGSSAITLSAVGQRFEGGGATTQVGMYFISHQSLGPGVGSFTLEKVPNGAAGFTCQYTIGSSRNYYMQGTAGNWSGSSVNLTKIRIASSPGNNFVAGSKITIYKRKK